MSVKRPVSTDSQPRRGAALRAAWSVALLTTVLFRPLGAEVLPDPVVTGSAPAHFGGFDVGNLFDGSRSSEYATAGGGAGDPFSTSNGTWIEFDFGSAVTLDRLVLITRNTSPDVIGESRLIFSDDPGFDANDTIHTIAVTGQRGSAPIHEFPATAARHVRWEVATAPGSGTNLGGIEMRFLNTPAGSGVVATTSVIGGTAPFSGDYALANAVNGNAGTTFNSGNPGLEYASAGAGSGMFVDFDFGSVIPVSGFDWFDRLSDRTTAFDLMLSNDPTFATGVTTMSYTPGGVAWGFGDVFSDPVPARYARLQATAVADSNTGIQEIIFYESAGDGLPDAFSSGSNPGGNWLHGEKTSAQSADITPYGDFVAATGDAPADRWFDAGSATAFAGLAPADAVSNAWGGVPTDWTGGAFYHAWREDHPFAITSRFIVQQSGAYDLDATWTSHTVPGARATAWIVVNGSTVASAILDGFAGTTHGSPEPSGPQPAAVCEAFGLHLAAGAIVDIVTVPESAAGNLAVTAGITAAALVAEPTATVVIREFSAANRNGPVDEDGDASDWIEIYNGTGAAVDLDGWSLTDREDQPGAWVFPPRVLPHGGHLVVFASGKDSIKRPGYGPGSELHTDFALSRDGEFLGLADPGGGYVSQFAPGFPPLFDDISYGTGSNDMTGYMNLTPGAPNGPATATPPAELSFSVPSGLFSGTIHVDLFGHGAEHDVRYTTNGTEPTLANGVMYSGPVTLSSAGATLRARAFADGIAGPLAQATYSLTGSAANYGVDPANFESALPLVVIDAATEPPGDKTPVAARFTLIDRDPVTGTARLSDSPALATRGTVNRRGQTSAFQPKKPYKIEFWGADDRPSDHEVLGMAPESDWVLYAAYQFDPDLLRNVLAFELYRDMGRWAPATRFVEVFFNTSSSGAVDGDSYRGVYVLMENVKVGKNRVDIVKPGPADNTGEAVTGGYLISRDKWPGESSPHPELIAGVMNAYPNWPFAASGDFTLRRPKWEDITAEQRAYIHNYTLECDTAVAQPDRRHPDTGLHIFDYLDTPSFIDHHMVNAFAKNVDGIRISTFLEKERGGKLAMSAVWDFDRSQGCDGDGRAASPFYWNSDGSTISTYYFSEPGRAAEGWFHHLHQMPEYLQAWVDRYDELREAGVFDAETIDGFLDDRAAELTAPDNHGVANADTPIARNFARWPRNTRGVPTDGSNAASVIFGSSPASEINRHKTWIGERLEFMNSWVLERPVASPAPGIVAAGSMLDLTSPDLTGGAAIYFTLDGSDPAADDGSISPAAQLWSGPVTIHQAVDLTARLHDPFASDKHTPWSPPFRGSYTIEGQTELVIHQWDFQDPLTYLQPSETIGGGVLTAVPGPLTEVVRHPDEAQGFDSAHLRVNNPLGSTLTWALPTSGFGTLTLTWETRRSGQGAGMQAVEVTTDGVTWNPLDAYPVADADPQLRTFDLSGVAAAEDNPDFAVRVTFSQGDGGTAGNNRFDNVALTGFPLPGEPVTFAEWRNLHFTDPAEHADDAISGPDADPAGHGIANLMRYALGLGPYDQPAPRLPRLTGGIYRFPMDPMKTDIVYRVLASDDLLDWSDVIFDSSQPGQLQPVDGWIDLVLDGGSASRKFFRLRIEAP